MKKHNAFVLAIVLLFASFPLTTAYAGSAPVALGTTRTTVDSGATYEISSQEELAHLSELVKDSQTCEGVTFVLTSDITVTNDYDSTSDGNWTPIGYLPDVGFRKNLFGGTFYGGNHTVTIDVRIGDYGGLFGAVISTGVVQDLIVAGSIVAGSNSGGITGYNAGIIRNCTNNASITDAAATGNENVGGIAGVNWGDIICCHNNGAISSENDCGGISGENSRNASDVRFCFNTNSVSGTENVGGISGNSLNNWIRTTENCYNTGNISGSSNVGGIHGYCGNRSETYGCYNTGSVTGTTNVGAIVGYMNDFVQNCYWLAGTAAKTEGNTGGPWPALCDSFQSDYMLDVSEDYSTSISLLSALESYFNMSDDLIWAQDPGTAPYLAGVRISSSDDQYAIAGGTASFTADVYGWSVTYQWQVSTDNGANWANLSGNGANTPTYTTPAMMPEMNGWKYKCVVGYVAGTAPQSTTTGSATLYLGSAPVIASQPPSIAYAADGQQIAIMGVEAGEAAPSLPGCKVISFVVAATPEADYTWYASSDGGIHYGTIGSGAIITMEPVLDGWMFYCVASNSFGSVTSAIVTLKRCPMPVISAQPQNASVTAGSKASFSVSASGDRLLYQWQVSSDGTKWNNVTDGSGQTTTSYTTVPTAVSMNGYKYRCVVTNEAGSVNTNAAALSVTELTLSSSDSDGRIYVGETMTLTPSVAGGVWTFDSACFSLSDNTFTALKAGTSMVTYTAGGVSVSYTVTAEANNPQPVSAPQPVSIGRFAAAKMPAKAKTDTMLTIIPPAAPRGYTVVSVTYSSNRPSVASVDASGNVTFLSGGKTTIITKVISQMTDRRGRVKTKTTTVKKSVTVSQPVASISLNQDNAAIARKQKLKLVAAIAPYSASNKKVIWKSGNPKVASVSGSGVVTGKAAGTTVITCRARDGSGASSSCTVTVTPIYPTAMKLSKTALTVKLGKTAALRATITPKTTDFKTVIWTSSNPAVAAVDAKGRIKGIAPGTAVITATTSNGIAASCTVTVP